MAKPDFRINKHGVNVADLKVGQWVELTWNDAPNEIALIVAIGLHPKSYKGERTLETLHWDNDGWFACATAVHTQVVRIVGMLDMHLEGYTVDKAE
jgi:hypothetical protein